MEKDRNQTKDSQRPVIKRRLLEGSGLKERAKNASAQFNELKSIKLDFNNLRLTELKKHNMSITASFYRGEPQYYDPIYIYREISCLMPEMETLYKKGVLRFDNGLSVKENDLWQTKFGGLSLGDIENMELDPQTHELAPEDIRRLNKMFRTFNIFRVRAKSSSRDHILEPLRGFALRQYIHPEMAVPKSLEKLQENITAYFDYYTFFLTDFKQDPSNERIMLLMFFLGAPHLPGAVASYIPAKLNITPASAIKLYKQHELLSPDRRNGSAWKKIEGKLRPTIQQAYREDAFPKDLAKYQHYDEKIDSAAADRMQSYIQENTKVDRQVQDKDEAESLLDQLDKHRRDVVRNVMQSKEKRIVYEISEDYPADRITLIRNRDTFVFIMHFSDNIHLTLELDKTGRLFGVPPSLVKAYPHVSDVFIVDILKPLLEKYKTQDVINVEQSAVTQIGVANFVPPIADFETPEDLMQKEDDEVEVEAPKRKRLLRMGTIFPSDPLPPVISYKSGKERFVIHSEDNVREKLGSKVGRQDVVVGQVLRAISNFESGYGRPPVMLKGDNTAVHIRAGNYRIIMNRLGGRDYSIREIVDRQDAYK